MHEVLGRIRDEGPLASKDFEAPPGRKSGSWFDWKPAKEALQNLFMNGSLMVSGRRGFQKVYDLTERVIPPGIDLSIPSPEEVGRHTVESFLRSSGLASLREIHYLRMFLRRPVQKAIQEWEEEGKIRAVEIEALPGEIFFVQPDLLEKIPFEPDTDQVHILSPFDNLMIQRRRIRELFGFEYTIECYLPVSKRKYGYFTLPILRGDRFIGRLDCKADRESKILVVHKMHFEAGFKNSEPLGRMIDEFARFNGCSSVLTAGEARLGTVAPRKRSSSLPMKLM
jgi:uncharacterized protein